VSSDEAQEKNQRQRDPVILHTRLSAHTSHSRSWNPDEQVSQKTVVARPEVESSVRVGALPGGVLWQLYLGEHDQVGSIFRQTWVCRFEFFLAGRPPPLVELSDGARWGYGG